MAESKNYSQEYPHTDVDDWCGDFKLFLTQEQKDARTLAFKNKISSMTGWTIQSGEILTIDDALGLGV